MSAKKKNRSSSRKSVVRSGRKLGDVTRSLLAERIAESDKIARQILETLGITAPAAVNVEPVRNNTSADSEEVFRNDAKKKQVAADSESTWYHRQGHACYLLRLCEGALPWPNEVLCALHDVASEHALDAKTPPRAEVDRAIALFEALPESERRRICNGWAYKGSPTEPLTYLKTLQEYSEPVERMLNIGDDGHGCRSEMDEHFESRNVSVSLVVRHGTPKRVVLDAMERLRCAVEKHFERMIVTRCLASLD